jgi:hypothetical protein
MGVFYKAVFNGRYQGKDNQNTFYYRSALDPFDGLFGWGGSRLLGELLVDHVVDAFVSVKPSEYTLETIDIYPYNDTLQAIFQLPYKMAVGEAGRMTFSQAATDGPAICANLRFNLEPVALGPQALTAPKRGYVAIGPIPSDFIDNAGLLIPATFDNPSGSWRALLNALVADLVSIAPPADFFPIRISQKWGVGELEGTLLSWGYADVDSAAWASYASFRRSRRITG